LNSQAAACKGIVKEREVGLGESQIDRACAPRLTSVVALVKDKKTFLVNKTAYLKFKGGAHKAVIKDVPLIVTVHEKPKQDKVKAITGSAKVDIVVEKKKHTAADALSMIGFHPVSAGTKPPLLDFYEQQFAELGKTENRED
jgi:hypothetical protein